MHKEEEYTDYSCSTSLESLSRDVETVLRTWHVDQGSDRHVSPSASKSGENFLLIRSNVIIWNFSTINKLGKRQNHSVDLELCLWDAPLVDSNKTKTQQQKEDSIPELVKSLQRPSFPDISDSFFENFSSIFGVGQHISLAPISPLVEEELVNYLASNILQRHDDERTAKSVLLATLSGWLQQSLNCAVSNCQCYLPVFGIWGEYRPNQLVPSHTMDHIESSTTTSLASPNNYKKASSSNSVFSDFDTLLGTTIFPSSQEKGKLVLFPNWMFRSVTLPPVGRKFKQRSLRNWNTKFTPSLVSGICVSPNKMAQLQVSVISGSHQKPIARLSAWASILLNQCEDSTVILCGARHVFGWFQPKREVKSSFLSSSYAKDDNTDWRRPSDIIVSQIGDSDIQRYRQHCRARALDLLEECWTQRLLWGPAQDPITSIHATATWISVDKNAGLVTFPLRIRSNQPLSKRDVIEMEESMETTILDPQNSSRFSIAAYLDRDIAISTLAANQRVVLAGLIRAATLPGETLLQHLTDEELVEGWDDNAGTIVATKLSQQAQVGSATLQLVKVMEWSGMMDDMISQRQAEEIVNQVFKTTGDFPDFPEGEFLEENSEYLPFLKSAPIGRLVSVLFAHLGKLQALSSITLVWGIFVDELRRRWEMRESLPNMQYVPGLDPHPQELYKNRHCLHTLGVKAEFSAFLNCSEPDPDDYHCLIGQKLQVFNLGVECIVASELLQSEAMERFLGTGEIPVTAAFSDRHPSTQNLSKEEEGTPMKKLEESLMMEKDLELSVPGRKWLSDSSSSNVAKTNGERSNYAPPAMNADLEFWVMDEPGHNAHLDEAFDYVHPVSSVNHRHDDNFDYHGGPSSDSSVSSSGKALPQEENGGPTEGATAVPTKTITPVATRIASKLMLDARRDSTLSLDTQVYPMDQHAAAMKDDSSVASSAVFFDAAEAGSIFSMKNGFLNLDTVAVSSSEQSSRRRPGARCPVQDSLIQQSGDQLFAPYLQRPSPLTDDLVLERRVMLSDRTISSSKNNSKRQQVILRSRLEVAQRLQKPKLFSDMCAFKAANPGSTIDDFTKWYGNPGSPLDDYSMIQETKLVRVKDLLKESAAKKLDKASEAMKILTSTRDFWSKTWESATPTPAAEQEPLFDYAMTVEMSIDYLEQMHPALLLNQVMAVNLSSAFFTLISSSQESFKIGLVKSAMMKLRQKIERALKVLSRDATGESIHMSTSTSFGDDDTLSHKSSKSGNAVGGNRYVSVQAIRVCEEACNMMSIAETMIARATSLLHKFPGQYNLIQDLLRLTDGAKVPLTDPEGRKHFLNVVSKQQQGDGKLPKPLIREYVFRNLDDENPCQLSVRSGSEEGTFQGAENNQSGGVLMALLKTTND